MDVFLDIVARFLPVELAVFLGIFIYVMVEFRRVARGLNAMYREMAVAADAETARLRKRMDDVERMLGISDKAIALRDSHIGKLEELIAQNASELRETQQTLVEAQTESELQDAQQRHARAKVVHSALNRLQGILANAANLQTELPALQADEIEAICELILRDCALLGGHLQRLSRPR